MPTPFAELLLQILHVDPLLPDPKRLEALGVTEWEDFTTEAIRYRLAYQVSEYLKAHDDLRSRVPEACLARLSQAVRPTVMMNLQRQAQLRQMLVACEAEGIPFLLMKGLWIVEHMYPTLAARASGDIDILLKPDDMPRFTHLVQEMGFDVDPEIGWSYMDSPPLMRCQHERGLRLGADDLGNPDGPCLAWGSNLTARTGRPTKGAKDGPFLRLRVAGRGRKSAWIPT